MKSHWTQLSPQNSHQLLLLQSSWSNILWKKISRYLVQLVILGLCYPLFYLEKHWLKIRAILLDNSMIIVISLHVFMVK